MIGILTLELHLPACTSLKEKRGRIKPLIARLRREFNLSVAETGCNDQWQTALLSCVMVGNERAFLDSALTSVSKWIHGNWPDGMIVDDRIELI
jgi:uncharacterized protein YlxP (DUF503 family)